MNWSVHIVLNHQKGIRNQAEPRENQYYFLRSKFPADKNHMWEGKHNVISVITWEAFETHSNINCISFGFRHSLYRSGSKTSLNRPTLITQSTMTILQQSNINQFVIKSYWHRTSSEHTAHLGGCGHSSISSQVETPLSKPHHGLITPVFGLCDVLIYLL